MVCLPFRLSMTYISRRLLDKQQIKTRLSAGHTGSIYVYNKVKSIIIGKAFFLYKVTSFYDGQKDSEAVSAPEAYL